MGQAQSHRKYQCGLNSLRIDMRLKDALVTHRSNGRDDHRHHIHTQECLNYIPYSTHSVCIQHESYCMYIQKIDYEQTNVCEHFGHNNVHNKTQKDPM